MAAVTTTLHRSGVFSIYQYVTCNEHATLFASLEMPLVLFGKLLAANIRFSELFSSHRFLGISLVNAYRGASKLTITFGNIAKTPELKPASPANRQFGNKMEF